MKTNEQRVKEILVSELGLRPEAVTRSARIIEDLGADSLDVVELGIYLEEEFGLAIPDEELMKLRTVEDVLEYLAEHGR